MDDEHKDKIKKAFAERFCLALKQAGYTVNQQKSMAKLFQVSGQAVRKWADAESMPTSARMTDVANILGVRRAWLQDGEAPMRSVVGIISDETAAYQVDSDTQIYLSKDEAVLMQSYRMLALKQKDVVKNIIDVFFELREKL